MCYMCCERNCKIDCYFNIGSVCKYGNEGYESETETPECNPSKCECTEETMENLYEVTYVEGFKSP